MITRQAYNSSHTKLAFIGPTGQEKLTETSVLVIGAGGLGCPCLQALAGAGIGTIGIADFDRVSDSNLHRQPLYQAEDVGQLKTCIAAKRLRAHNPLITIHEQQCYVSQENILELMQPYDIIIDATDNFATRYLINDGCVVLGKPLVYGAIHQSEGHLTVFNYNKSGTLRCLFANDENTSVESCSVIGAYNIVTALIGNLMANEVIKLVLKHEAILANTLLQADALEGRMMKIKYQLVSGNIAISQQRFQQQQIKSGILPDELELMLADRAGMLLIDVRDDAEHAGFNIGGLHLPLSQLLQTDRFEFDPEKPIVVYCQKGLRSEQAANWLRLKGYLNARSLQGGLDNWKGRQ